MEKERMEEGESILLFDENEFIFLDHGSKCEASARWVMSNQAWSKISHPWERNCIFFSREAILLITFPVVRCRSEPSRWWKWAQAGPIDTCAGPWAFQRSLLLLLLLLLCHLSVSLMVSSHGLLLQHNRFHLPVKPPGRLRSVTKDSEREKVEEGRGEFFSPTQTHLPPPLSSQSPSSDQIKMLQSHFSLSVQDIIIQHDFWTASRTIRGSATLGKKMWFKLVLYYITVYLWSLLPSHTLSVSFWGCSSVCVCVCVCVYAWMHLQVLCIHNQQEFIYT